MGGTREEPGRPSPRTRAQAAVFRVGERIGKRYRVEDIVGSGGVGVVYRAHDELTGGRVAVKVINAKLVPSPEDRRAFARQLRLSKTLVHPNVARIEDDGVDEGRPFFTTAYFDGLSLQKIIDLRKNKGQVFSLGEVAPIFEQLSRALDYAHPTMLHGNLKPDNVVLLPDLLKVTDFSILQGLPRKPFLAIQRQRGASYRYLAPEVRKEAASLSAAADVYGMGVILGEMLTGIVHDDGAPDALSGAAAELAPSLVGLLTSSVASRPADRPESARAFLSELRRALGGFASRQRLERAAERSSVGGRGEQPPRSTFGSLAQTEGLASGRTDGADLVERKLEAGLVAELGLDQEVAAAAIDALRALEARDGRAETSLELLEEPGLVIVSAEERDRLDARARLGGARPSPEEQTGKIEGLARPSEIAGHGPHAPSTARHFQKAELTAPGGGDVTASDVARARREGPPLGSHGPVADAVAVAVAVADWAKDLGGFEETPSSAAPRAQRVEGRGQPVEPRQGPPKARPPELPRRVPVGLDPASTPGRATGLGRSSALGAGPSKEEGPPARSEAPRDVLAQEVGPPGRAGAPRAPIDGFAADPLVAPEASEAPPFGSWLEPSGVLEVPPLASDGPSKAPTAADELDDSLPSAVRAGLPSGAVPPGSPPSAVGAGRPSGAFPPRSLPSGLPQVRGSRRASAPKRAASGQGARARGLGLTAVGLALLIGGVTVWQTRRPPPDDGGSSEAPGRERADPGARKRAPGIDPTPSTAQAALGPADSPRDAGAVAEPTRLGSRVRLTSADPSPDAPEGGTARADTSAQKPRLEARGPSERSAEEPSPGAKPPSAERRGRVRPETASARGSLEQPPFRPATGAEALAAERSMGGSGSREGTAHENGRQPTTKQARGGPAEKASPPKSGGEERGLTSLHSAEDGEARASPESGEPDPGRGLDRPATPAGASLRPALPPAEPAGSAEPAEPDEPEPDEPDGNGPLPDEGALASLIEPPAEPKPTCPRGMTLVDAGAFMIGAPRNDPERNFGDQDHRSVQVEAFCIDYYEHPNGRGRMPTVDVTWAAADARCRRRGKRLCTEEEWEKACKGKAGLRYPYGNAWDAARCNTEDAEGQDREPVGSGTFRTCRSAFNVFDLGGNVGEWTATPSGNGYVVKGGASDRPGYDSRCAARKTQSPSERSPGLGFRCCREPS